MLNPLTVIQTKILMAAAGAFLLLALASGVALKVTVSNLKVANASIKTLNAEVDRLSGSVTNCSTANKQWKQILATANARIIELQKAELERIEHNRKMLAAEAARRVKAENTLSSWRIKYQQLTQSADCAPLLNTPVCPALQENVR